jgi:hypothetical protein
VQVEHELRERAVHARQAAAQHGEARAGQLGAGGRSSQPWRSPSAMWSRGSNSKLRGSPTRLTSTLAIRRCLPARCLRQVRHAQRDRVELGADLVQPRFPALSSSPTPATSAISFDTSSPRDLAMPIALELVLRLFCSSWVRACSARRSDSSACIAATSRSKPRAAFRRAAVSASAERSWLASSMGLSGEKQGPGIIAGPHWS